MKSIILFTASLVITLPTFAHDGEHGHSHKPQKPHPPLAAEPAVAVKTGQGKHVFETVPEFGKLPEGKLGPTHGGVAVSKNGDIYVSTDGEKSIAVFSKDGKFIKSLPAELQGIHGMQIVTEGDKEYIYAAHLKQNQAVKIDLDGNIILKLPNEKTGELKGGTKGLTAIAVAPDGSIFLSMGYGSNFIHKLEKNGILIRTFGGGGKGEKQLRTPHGLAIDTRFEEPRLLVCDRANKRLLHYDLDGKWIGVHATNLRLPCAVSFHGDDCAVAELAGRVAILDIKGNLLSELGDNPDLKQRANFKVAPEDQKPGIFTAPHGLSYDAEGNLYVQDWNFTGRITKLKHIK